MLPPYKLALSLRAKSQRLELLPERLLPTRMLHTSCRHRESSMQDATMSTGTDASNAHSSGGRGGCGVESAIAVASKTAWAGSGSNAQKDGAFGTDRHSITVDADESVVDFSNAGIYLTALQTVFTVTSCAAVSVLACWIAPEGGVSAVRTLALATGTGVVLMRHPLHVGRAHGVRVVFGSLQPAIALYIASLVVEQLIHTCTSDSVHSPSWRRVVFHGMTVLMIVSGFLRARGPLNDTDLPFLVTTGALLVIALMPPPAVALVGPLCQSVGLFEAAERLLRAVVFSVLYCCHVYASTDGRESYVGGTSITVSRSGSATIWVMACHPILLLCAIPQGIVVVMVRLRMEQRQLGGNGNASSGGYRALSQINDDEEGALEEVKAHVGEKFQDEAVRPSNGIHGIHAVRTPLASKPLVAAQCKQSSAATPTAPPMPMPMSVPMPHGSYPLHNGHLTQRESSPLSFIDDTTYPPQQAQPAPAPMQIPQLPASMSAIAPGHESDPESLPVATTPVGPLTFVNIGGIGGGVNELPGGASNGTVASNQKMTPKRMAEIAAQLDDMPSPVHVETVQGPTTTNEL